MRSTCLFCHRTGEFPSEQQKSFIPAVLDCLHQSLLMKCCFALGGGGGGGGGRLCCKRESRPIQHTSAYVLFEMLYLIARLLLISPGCDGGEVREQVNSWWMWAVNPELSA